MAFDFSTGEGVCEVEVSGGSVEMVRHTIW